MNLYIDTNVFLTFYHLSDEDIGQLEKLVSLIERKTIALFVTEQVCDEFNRNREVKIKDALAALAKASFKISFPAFCKPYEEFGELRELIKQATKKYSDLEKKVTSAAKSNSLNADPIIAKLFDIATIIETKGAAFGAAVNRYRVGNPPGKKKMTLGDELNWETLLEDAPNKQDIHFVSADTDYTSPLDEKAMHPFLIKEWEKKKSSKIHFYTKLSDFFSANYPFIKLASEVEKGLAIEGLSGSGSFATTHLHISALESITDFTPQEVELLIIVGEKNTQVNWIMGDKDVHTFYKRLLDQYGPKIDAERSKWLAEELGQYEEIWAKKAAAAEAILTAFDKT